MGEDIPVLAEMNLDPEVMAFFPATQGLQQSISFVRQMQRHFMEKGYCYFAVDRLDRPGCIGFIGLKEQTFEADFTPCVDIGWRLKKSEWNQGFAKEGADRCLSYGFTDLGLDRVYSFAPKINIKSESIMKYIGMHKVKEFEHPLLQGDSRLNPFVLYVKQA